MGAHAFLSDIEELNFLLDCQHGFCSQRSYETQLITFVQDLLLNMSGGSQTDVILMDFSKTFNKVPHRRLLTKLHYYDVRSSVLTWIEAFLTTRHQRVLIDGETSDYTQVRPGVPQGTVLGLLLFLIFVNDLPDKVVSNVRLFADNPVLYRKINTSEDYVMLQKDLDKLLEWEDKWQMAFHPQKYKVLNVTLTRKPVRHIYHIRETELENVSHAA